ncbi:MAG: dnaN [Rickettsiaceae bacterium]|jgi:DNA polymerase-3 subunit beta|nr:dnaN [Rickettsiaceae bacterium]
METAIDTQNTLELNNSIENQNSILEFEIEAQTKDLNRALGLLSSVVEKKNVIPVLSNVKLTVNDSLLTLTATDMDLSIAEQINIQPIKSGELTVAAKTLSDIVRHISDETVKLKYVPETEQLMVLGENCQFNLSTLPAHEFPTLEQTDSIAKFNIPSDNLARLIDNTKFSISTEETRYNLNGIYFHIMTEGENKFFAAASTDGHRLSLAYTEAPENVTSIGIILPKKAALELQKILKDTQCVDHEVVVDLSNTKAKFVCNKITLISKLIDGNFPDYQAFIPKNNNNKLAIDSKQLASAINRVATITVEKFRAIKMEISTEGVEFSAFGEARGSAREYIKAGKESAKGGSFVYEGDSSLSIGFNPKYITDVLDAVKGREVSIELRDSFSPAVIRDTSDPHSLFVVMPIKV